MARVIGIDYGTKRVGISATDELQIAVHPITVLDPSAALDFLVQYTKDEKVEKVVVGVPVSEIHDNSKLIAKIQKFMETLNQRIDPNIIITTHDESFTSEDAFKIILQSGTKKMKRRDKSLIDKVSAVLILQDYLNHI